MDIYEIMDNFGYKFQDEDFKNKWVVYGGAKRIIDIIDEQKSKLEKEKIRFKEKMESEQ